MGIFLVSLIAFILLPALLIYSMVKPAKFNIRTKRNPSGRWSRGKFLLGIFAVWIATIAVGAAITPDPNTTIDINKVTAEGGLEKDDYKAHENGAIKVKAEKPVKTTEPVEEVIESKVTPQDKTFGITPEEFGKRLSAQGKEFGLENAEVGKFDIQEGSVNDIFSEILSDALAMNGSVDKNGELKGVTYIMGRTENGDKEILTMMMMAGLTARALSPDLPKEQTAGALPKMVSEAVQQLSETGEGKSSTVVDGITYGVVASKSIGIWIYFEPAEI